MPVYETCVASSHSPCPCRACTRQRKAVPAFNAPASPPGMARGSVFAKSCALPDGLMDFSNYNEFVPVEALTQYGEFVVLGTDTRIAGDHTDLHWIGGSLSARLFAARLQGSLAVKAPPRSRVVVTVLMPSTNSGDSAFYRHEQYGQLTEGNTRVRLTVKHLHDGAISAYGFYTGTKREWQRVPVIAAHAHAEQRVARVGNGLEISWKPAPDPSAIAPLAPLEGASLKPAAWVFPPSDQADTMLVNPVYPPDYQDAIVWFPGLAHRAPVYVSINVRLPETGEIHSVG